MRICMIAAIGKNRELGSKNKLLWNIPEDMAHFRAMTKGKPVVMGTKTFESIGRPLPGRMNIVVSRSGKNYEGVTVVSSLEEAYARAREAGADEVFNIGGATLYAAGLKDVDTLYLTLVDAVFPEADAFFPAFEHVFQRVSGKTSGDANFCYEFVEYKKI